MHKALALLALLLASCSRSGEPEATGQDAAPSASSTPVALPPAAAVDAPASDPVLDVAAAFEPAEARRVAVSRLADEPLLVPLERTLRGHFTGEALPVPIDVQILDLPRGKRAILATKRGPSADPVLLVQDPDGAVAWIKDFPLRGVAPEVTALALGGGPNGEIALFWYDQPTRWVATRMWNDDSSILVDFQILQVDGCDTLSVVQWPQNGWFVVASHLGTARAQMLAERGTIAWAKEGVDVSSGGTLTSPVSLVADTKNTMMLFQVGVAREGGKRSEGRVLASRFNTVGTMLWDHPIDIGLAPPSADPGASAKPEATRMAPGRVRIGVSPLPVELTSSGTLVRP